jgi:hypothetical protein
MRVTTASCSRRRLAQAYRLDVSFRRADATDVNLLAKQQPALDHDNLFDRGHDGQIALFLDRRNGFDVPPDWHTLDLDALARKLLWMRCSRVWVTVATRTTAVATLRRETAASSAWSGTVSSSAPGGR